MHPDDSIAIMDRSKGIFYPVHRRNAKQLMVAHRYHHFGRRERVKSRYRTRSVQCGLLIRSLTCILELASHPDVLEVSVIARLHEKWGERPMAFVVLHPQHVAKWKGRHADFFESLKTHAKTRLPGFACPEWCEVVPDLPVNNLSFLVL